jgi:hypothetical protein
MIYTHVMKKGARGVRSPLDRAGASPERTGASPEAAAARK